MLEVTTPFRKDPHTYIMIIYSKYRGKRVCVHNNVIELNNQYGLNIIWPFYQNALLTIIVRLVTWVRQSNTAHLQPQYYIGIYRTMQYIRFDNWNQEINC